MIARLERALGASGGPDEGIRRAVELIHESNPLYHWTGIYLLEGRELVLSHQIGLPTPHETISIEKGICGAAAREKATVIVDDVNADPRYIACSLRTRSEIVVPIMTGRGEVLGEIDIDSDQPAAFGEADRELLEEAAGMLAGFLESRAGKGLQGPAAKGIRGTARRPGGAEPAP